MTTFHVSHRVTADTDKPQVLNVTIPETSRSAFVTHVESQLTGAELSVIPYDEDPATIYHGARDTPRVLVVEVDRITDAERDMLSDAAALNAVVIFVL